MRKFILVLLPVVLLAWGEDQYVASADTTDGVFSTYTAVLDKNGRQAVFAVKNKSPYNMYVYLEDTSTGTFSELSHPLNFNVRPRFIKAYYNWRDSSTYVFSYTPESGYSNMHLIVYDWQYSWTFSSIHYIDGAPDDTIKYPVFKTLYSGGNLYMFVLAVKETGGNDSVFAYTSTDAGNTWNRHFLSYILNPGKYAGLGLNISVRNDTIFVWRSVLYTSNDTLYHIGTRIYTYDPTQDVFQFHHSISNITDTSILNFDIVTWGDTGIIGYTAKTTVKIQPVAFNGLIGSPVILDPNLSYSYLIGIVKGYTFGFPGNAYFGIAYTDGIAFLPNTENIYYVETDDGLTFTSPDTLNDTLSTVPVIKSYDRIIYREPAILYVNVEYHGNFPFFYWDATHLYVDRKFNRSAVNEKPRKVTVNKTIIAHGTLKMDIIANGDQQVNINLYNSAGQFIKNVYKGRITGNLKINSDIRNLKNGIYFIKDSYGRIPTVKILIQ